jgi:predicted O-methyltransferase YrrM
VNRVKYAIRVLLGLPTYYYRPRSTVPAATNMPVLISIGRTLRIRRVVEFGAGLYSTLTFLDRSAFPLLERIVSFETDPEWLDRVLAASLSDPRLELRLIDREVAKTAASYDFTDSDLVFIDNGPDWQARVATIETVVRRHQRPAVIVIHDFEQPVYVNAADPMPRRFVFDAFVPYTGVLWHGDLIPTNLARHFRVINREINKNLATRPDDRRFWIQAIHSLSRPTNGAHPPRSQG